MPVCEMSWVLETNTQTCHSIEEIGGRVCKMPTAHVRPGPLTIQALPCDRAHTYGLVIGRCWCWSALVIMFAYAFVAGADRAIPAFWSLFWRLFGRKASQCAVVGGASSGPAT